MATRDILHGVGNCRQFFVGIITAAGGFFEQFPSGVTWTLVVEIGFYILLPIIVLGRSSDKRYIWISLAAWTILSLLVSHYYFYLKGISPDSGLTKFYRSIRSLVCGRFSLE